MLLSAARGCQNLLNVHLAFSVPGKSNPRPGSLTGPGKELRASAAKGAGCEGWRAGPRAPRGAASFRAAGISLRAQLLCGSRRKHVTSKRQIFFFSFLPVSFPSSFLFPLVLPFPSFPSLPPSLPPFHPEVLFPQIALDAEPRAGKSQQQPRGRDGNFAGGQEERPRGKGTGTGTRTGAGSGIGMEIGTGIGIGTGTGIGTGIGSGLGIGTGLGKG